MKRDVQKVARASGRFSAVLAAGWTLSGFGLAAERSVARTTEIPETGDYAPLTERGLTNVTAFTRLLGYVRYFHPSDEAAATDWNTFAIAGMRAIGRDLDRPDCARVLQELFTPIAPSVRIVSSDAPNPAAAFSPAAPATWLVRWTHFGLRHGEQNVYQSSRDRVLPTDGRLPVLTPDLIFRAPVAPGLDCLVPLALLGDSTGTQPRGRLGGTVSTAPALVSDRATRLAVVALAWNPIQHSYPYFDVVENKWFEALTSALASAAVDADAFALTITLRHMIAALEDGHGSVTSPIMPLLGVPAIDWEWVEGKVVVTSVNDPAITGIAPGDALIVVNNRPVSVVLAEKISECSGATSQWKLFRAVRELAVGRRGASATLVFKLFNRGEERRTVVVPLEHPVTPLPERHSPAKTTEYPGGIHYVDVTRITSAEFVAMLPALERAKGIVFDLRGYPLGFDIRKFLGHLSRTPMRGPQFSRPVIARPDRETMSFVRGGEWEIDPQAPVLSAKRAFIADGRAVSAAETLLGVIEYYRLGDIVGTTTAGTNGNVNRIPLPAGFAVTFTGMKVLKQDGSRHHGVGIRPTIRATRTQEGIADGRDELLERAIAALAEP